MLPRWTIPPEIGPDPRNHKNHVVIPPEMCFAGSNNIRYDFNFSWRLDLPLNRKYRIRAFDEHGVLLEEIRSENGGKICGSRKYFIAYTLEVLDDSSGQELFRHQYDCRGKRIYIVIPDGGLGDNLAWMPYAQAFQQKYGARVCCVIGEWMIQLVGDLYPDLEFLAIGNRPQLTDAYGVYFCAIFPEERKNWRPVDHQLLGMQGSIARALGGLPEPLQIRLPLGSQRTIPEKYVCISVMATNPCKHWNWPDGWNILIRWLRDVCHLRVLCIDRDREFQFGKTICRIPEEAEDFTGVLPLRERIALLEHAEFFIGLPSGLSWLAWNCKIPVVMLSGFTFEGCEFPTPYRVCNYHFCHGCWNDSHIFFDATKAVWCPRHEGTPREIECTKVISPQMVQNTIRQIPGVKELEKTQEEQAKISRGPGKIGRASVTKAYAAENCLVSFIISAYECEKYLSSALDSVIKVARSVPDSEVLVADDGSKDNSAQIIREYAAKYPRLIVPLLRSRNVGVADSRQELIAHARGKFLVIFDADDILLPFDLSKAIQKLENAGSAVAASYAPKYLFDDNGLTGVVHGGNFSLFNAFFTPKVNINAMLLKRQECLLHQGFRPLSPVQLDEDVFLMVRLAMDRDLLFDPEPRSFYRRHSGQLTAVRHGNYNGTKLMLEYVIQQYPEIYQEISAGRIPERTPENFRIVAGLCGGAVFLRQKDLDFCRKLCLLALEQDPDDYGIWEHYLLLLALSHMEKEFYVILEKARARFVDQPFIRYVFAGVELRMLKMYGKGQLSAEGTLDYQRYFRLPDLVARNQHLLQDALKQKNNNSITVKGII